MSLFDGMSCGQIALRDLGFPIEKYYASEIDKFAIQQTQLNFPDTVQLGDVRNIDVDRLCEDVEIDLLLAGFPCTDLSLAGKRRGMSTTTKEKVTSLSQYIDLKDAGFEFAGQSYLFWEFVRIFQRLRERNPKLIFLLENVEVGKEWDAVISDTLGIHGVHINSALVSAQNRKRIYWSNIRVREEGLFGYRYTDIPQPADRGILLRDILEKEVDVKYYLKNEVVRNLLIHKERNKKAGNGFGAVFHDTDGKMAAVKVKGCVMYDLIQEPTSNCLRIPEATKQGYVDIQQGEAFDMTQPNSKTRRGRKMSEKCNCLTTESQGNYLLFEGVETNNHLQKNLTDVDSKANAFLATSHKGAWANGMSLVSRGLRIRRITPTECARLQTIPEWYRWEYVKKYIDINLCEPNVELTAAKDILQTKRPDYVICTILGSSEQVQLMKGQKLINQKNAQWTVAIDNVPHISDYASCTIKGLRGMEQQTLSHFSLNMKRYVLYVEKLSTEEMEVQKDYAQNIIAVLKFTETQVRLIRGAKSEKIILEFEDICQGKEECQRIERFMKITLVENCKDMNVFITSILIKQIIELRTCIFSNLKMSTKKLMLSFQLSPLNLSSVALLNLRMGIIASTSETQQYMMLGNGWTVEVIKHILSFIKIEEKL